MIAQDDSSNVTQGMPSIAHGRAVPVQSIPPMPKPVPVEDDYDMDEGN